jgi:hypothetical protein
MLASSLVEAIVAEHEIGIIARRAVEQARALGMLGRPGGW